MEHTLNPLGERLDVQRLELGIIVQHRHRMQPGFGHGSAGRRDFHDHLTQVAPARARLHDGDAVDPLSGVEAGLVQQAVGVAADDQVNGAVRERLCQLYIPPRPRSLPTRSPGYTPDG